MSREFQTATSGCVSLTGEEGKICGQSNRARLVDRYPEESLSRKLEQDECADVDQPPLRNILPILYEQETYGN